MVAVTFLATHSLLVSIIFVVVTFLAVGVAALTAFLVSKRGDRRFQVSNSAAMRIFSETAPTTKREYQLMHGGTKPPDLNTGMFQTLGPVPPKPTAGS